MPDFFCDKKDFAQSLWPGRQIFSAITPEDYRGVQFLLPGKEWFGAEFGLNPPWRCVIAVEHSHSSQFELFRGYLQTNQDIMDGLICITGSGEGFIGYRNRSWATIPGNLHVTAFLKPMTTAPEIYVGMIMIAALSVVQAIDEVPGLEGRAGIKWVNDILMDSKKVAGVITHTQSQGRQMTGVLLGIGVNVESCPVVEPDRFVPGVTCLNAVLTDPPACRLPEFLHTFLHKLGQNYLDLVAGRFTKILELYRSRSVVIGKEVDIYSDPHTGDAQHIARGRVLGISERLELLIEGYDTPVNRGRLVII